MRRVMQSGRLARTSERLLQTPYLSLAQLANRGAREGRTGCGTEADTASGGDGARDPPDTCLPIWSRPRVNEVRDDAGTGRRAPWGHCRRDREDYQALVNLLIR